MSARSTRARSSRHRIPVVPSRRPAGRLHPRPSSRRSPSAFRASWLFALLLASAPLAADDLVVLRSGESRTGTLKSCIDDRC
ncbi:MAG: hypothetical protein LC732_03330, partial [Acidobacteria bacterium]|nr:hypothetical protein [Acidobacteriota bacterium]